MPRNKGLLEHLLAIKRIRHELCHLRYFRCIVTRDGRCSQAVYGTADERENEENTKDPRFALWPGVSWTLALQLSMGLFLPQGGLQVPEIAWRILHYLKKFL